MQLLDTKAAAEYLGGLSKRTLQQWRHLGRGPKYRKLGGAVRYHQADLDAYVEDATRASTSDPGSRAA